MAVCRSNPSSNPEVPYLFKPFSKVQRCIPGHGSQPQAVPFKQNKSCEKKKKRKGGGGVESRIKVTFVTPVALVLA